MRLLQAFLKHKFTQPTGRYLAAALLLTSSFAGIIGGVAPAIQAAADNGVISGHVRIMDGIGITDVLVQAKQGADVRMSTSTDTSGGYTLAGLAAGSYTLRASAAGYQTLNMGGFVVSAGATTTANLVLVAILPVPPLPTGTGALSGQVVSSENGTGIASALALLKLTDPFGHDEHSKFEVLAMQATTDAKGNFSFSGLEPGEYRLKAKAEGFHSGTVGGIAVLANQTSVVNIALEPEKERNEKGRGSIAGRVTNSDNGKAIEGAVVFSTPHKGKGHESFVRTDGDGKFVLTDVRAGEHQLHVMARGFRPENRKVQVEADKRVLVDIALSPLPEPKAKNDRDENKRGDDRDDDHGRKDDDHKVAPPIRPAKPAVVPPVNLRGDVEIRGKAEAREDRSDRNRGSSERRGESGRH